MEIEWIIIPLIAGLIGYFTNFTAVKMIFHPKKPIGIGPFKIQGVLPKRREELAESIAFTVEDKLVSSRDIIEKVKGMDLESGFRDIIDKKIDEFVNKNILKVHPMLSTFITENMQCKIKNILREEIQEVLPSIYEMLAQRVEKTIDMKALVREKISTFSMDKLEKIVVDIASRELRAIEIFGGIVGIIIGFVQLIVLNIIG